MRKPLRRIRFVASTAAHSEALRAVAVRVGLHAADALLQNEVDQSGEPPVQLILAQGVDAAGTDVVLPDETGLAQDAEWRVSTEAVTSLLKPLQARPGEAARATTMASTAGPPWARRCRPWGSRCRHPPPIPAAAHRHARRVSLARTMSGHVEDVMNCCNRW
jgi:hypothetical protein